MNIRLKNPASPPSGALMGVALMLMLCSGLFLASWVTMMSTRSIQVSWLEAAVQRRIGLENSRLLSWQTSMDHAFDPEADLDGKSALLMGGKSGALTTVDGWADLNVYTVLNSPATMLKAFPYNATGVRPGGSYLAHEEFARAALPADVLLDNFTAHEFLKSLCPVLNGDLFVVYRKPDRALKELNIYTDTAPFQILGRTVIRHPPSLFVRTTSQVTLPFFSKALYIQSHDSAGRYPILGTGLNGAAMLPSNLPAVPSSTGPNSATDSKLFDGYLNVINNVDNPTNSLCHTQANQGGKVIDVYNNALPTTDPYWMAEYIDKPPIPPPDYDKGGYNVPFKTLYINVAHPQAKHLRINHDVYIVDQIVFVGQTSAANYEAAGAMSPLIVTLLHGKGAPVRNIVFQHENNRRLIFGTKDLMADNTLTGQFASRQLVFSWAGDSILGRELRWRITHINEGHAILLNLHPNAATDIRWIGGVMTNWSFQRNTNTGPRTERLILQADSAAPTLPVTGVSYESLLPREAWLESYFLPQSPDSL